MSSTPDMRVHTPKQPE
jgi:putative acetyltransferase